MKMILHMPGVVLPCLVLLLACCVDDDPVLPQGAGFAWDEVDFPRYNGVRCIAADPDDRIFVGTCNRDSRNPSSQIYISPDNGESWRKGELGAFWIHSLEIDSQGRLFAMENNCSMLRSLDHGECWEALKYDSISGCHDKFVIDANDNLYLPTSRDGVYISTDHGDSWVRLCEAISPESYLYSVLVDSKGCLYARTSEGLYRSRDGGENWQELANVPWGERYAGIQLGSTDQILAYANDILYVSEDEGESWTTLIPPPDIYRIFPDGWGRLFYICADSLYMSDESGSIRFSLFDFQEYPLSTYIAVNAAGDIFVTGRWGISRSIDDGESWEMLGFSNHWPVDIARGGNGSFYILLRYGGFYRSIDNLENWTVFNTGLPLIESSSLVNGPDSTMMAGTADGVYVSSEDRPQWHRAGLAGNRVVRLFTFPGDSIAASTEDNGLFISTDGGTEWLNIGLVGYNTRDLVKTDDGHLVAGANFGGIFRYTGEGILWDQANSGLADLRVTALAAISNGDILAGTERGLFVSANGGTSWKRFDREDLSVKAICVTYEDILVGTVYGEILWTRTGIAGLHSLNDGARGPITAIVTDPDRFVYILSPHTFFKSVLSLGDISPAGL